MVRIYLICGQRGMVVVRSQERKDCLYVCDATHKGHGSELASGSRSQIAGHEDMREYFQIRSVAVVLTKPSGR